MDTLEKIEPVIFEPDEPVKKKRAPRKKKAPVSELDESIVRELKKNRVNTKVLKQDCIHNEDTEKLTYIIDKVNELIATASPINKIYIYIVDKLHDDNSLSYLVLAEDAYTIVVNNDIVYNDLRMQSYNLTDDVKLYFFDDKLNLTEHT